MGTYRTQTPHSSTELCRPPSSTYLTPAAAYASAPHAPTRTLGHPRGTVMEETAVIAIDDELRALQFG